MGLEALAQVLALVSLEDRGHGGLSIRRWRQLEFSRHFPSRTGVGDVALVLTDRRWSGWGDLAVPSDDSFLDWSVQAGVTFVDLGRRLGSRFAGNRLRSLVDCADHTVIFFRFDRLAHALAARTTFICSDERAWSRRRDVKFGREGLSCQTIRVAVLRGKFVLLQVTFSKRTVYVSLLSWSPALLCAGWVEGEGDSFLWGSKPRLDNDSG